jgi:branched-chain amino acid transport system ATP-binding protein/urea transport system ATP-binding protein
VRNVEVEVRGLTMQFGGVRALDQVDFELGRRELRCLIGPNGAGKSTFFKCLSGLLVPTSGEIRIRGETTTGWLPHRIARLGIGIKTQVPSVMNGLTVRENIWLAARREHTTADANRMAASIAARVLVDDVLNEQVETLAHGKRQLVELAIVLAGKPWLVLLDEPAAGLTAVEVDRMIEVIRDINSEAALIIVEHDMHFVRRIASQVTVFNQGRVLIDADVEEVMSNPDVRDVYLGKQL